MLQALRARWAPIKSSKYRNAFGAWFAAKQNDTFTADLFVLHASLFAVGIKSYDELGGPLLVTYTCALGAWCGNLQKGTTSAKIGYVSPRCPSPPPPGKPVVCPGGAGAQSVSIDGTRKTTVDGYFLGSEATYTFAADAAECKAKALEARCGGRAVSFYLFTPDSCKKPIPSSLGTPPHQVVLPQAPESFLGHVLSSSLLGARLPSSAASFYLFMPDSCEEMPLPHPF